MASVDAIKMGEGSVAVKADLTPLQKGLKDAKKEFEAWGKSLTSAGATFAALGATITAPFIYALHVFGEMGDHIAVKSRQTGIAFEDLQTLAFGLRVDLDDLGKASKKLDSFIGHAADGSEEAIGKLAQLGLSLQDLSKMSQGDRIRAVGEALEKAFPDVSQRHAVQVQLFGKAGLALDFSNLAARENRLGQLGGVISDKDIDLARDYARSTKEMGVAVGGVWARLGATVAPLFIRWFDGITGFLVYLQKLIDNNRELLSVVFRVGEWFGIIGAGLLALGGVFKLAAAAIGVMLTPAVVTIGLFKAVAAVIMGTVVPAVVSFIAATWPIWLIAGAIYLVYTYSEELGQMFEYIGQVAVDTWSAICDWVNEVWEDMLAFFESVGQIAVDTWDAVAEAWDTAITWIEDLAQVFGTMFDPAPPAAEEAAEETQGIWAAAFSDIWDDAQGLWGQLTSGFEEYGQFISDTWDDIWEGIRSVFGDVIDSIVEMFNGVIDYWTEALGRFADTFFEMWGGIGDAISAGNWELAFEITWVGLQLIFTRAVNGMYLAWLEFSNQFDDAWDAVCSAIAHAFITVSSFLEEAFYTISETVEDIFNGVVSTIVGIVNSLIRAMPETIRNRLGIEELTDPNSDENRASREAERTRARNERQATADAMHEDIDRQQEEAEQRRATALEAARETAQAEEDELQGRLDSLRDQAHSEAEDAARARRTLLDRAPGGGEEDEIRTAASQIMGSFSAAAISGQGVAGNPQERTARAAEETARRLAEVNEWLELLAEDEGEGEDD